MVRIFSGTSRHHMITSFCLACNQQIAQETFAGLWGPAASISQKRSAENRVSFAEQSVLFELMAAARRVQYSSRSFHCILVQGTQRSTRWSQQLRLKSAQTTRRSSSQRPAARNIQVDHFTAFWFKVHTGQRLGSAAAPEFWPSSGAERLTAELLRHWDCFFWSWL